MRIRRSEKDELEQWRSEPIGDPSNFPQYVHPGLAVGGAVAITSDVRVFARRYGRFVDRVGDERGSYLFVEPAGGPVGFEQRSLPAGDVAKPHRRYEFTGHLPDGWWVEVSQVAPWFGRPGGAVQVRVLMSDGAAAAVRELLNSEYYVLRKR